jgi:hypothetical protein
LFIIEGAITIALAPLMFYVFPKSPTDAWFLSDEEKEIMRIRHMDPYWGYATDEKFTWRQVRNSLKDPKQWC